MYQEKEISQYFQFLFYILKLVSNYLCDLNIYFVYDRQVDFPI